MVKPHALIVEDNPQLNMVFSITLQDDFEVESVDSGSRALEYLKEHVPDIVILDIHMPGVSGDQVLQYVRSAEHLAPVRVIVTTADNSAADALTAEADLVLLKPVNPIQLHTLATRIILKNAL